MALMSLVYRDKLFPRTAYARTFDQLVVRQEPRRACKVMVELLSLAHERACEAELAHLLEAELEQGLLPDLETIRKRFAPQGATLPAITVTLPALSAHDVLHSAARAGGAQ